MQTRILAIAVLASLTLSLTSLAQTYTYWQRDPALGPGDWSDPTNWTNGEPSGAAVAYINNGGTVQITQVGEVATHLYLGVDAGESGTVEMNSGDLTLQDPMGSGIYVGRHGTGTFVQTGGTHLASSLALAYYTGSAGTYQLSGTGQLNAGSENIGYKGNAQFTQTGGTNTVDRDLHLGWRSGSTGRYDLSGTGELFADREYVGQWGEAIFAQTGGSNTTNYLSVGPNGQYEYSGGNLDVRDGWNIDGQFDFSGKTMTLDYQSVIVDLTGGSVLNAENVSLSLGSNALIILDADDDPTLMFGSYSNTGITHIPGTDLVIAADEGFAGSGVINDYVECQGTITAGQGGFIDLTTGLRVSSGGDVDLGEGSLHVDNDMSIITGGKLSAGILRIGYSNTGHFTQSAGETRFTYLYAGKYPGQTGSYTLTGGTTTAERVSIGRTYGSVGKYLQTGGSHTIEGYLVLGSEFTGGNGTYSISGGSLTVPYLYVGPKTIEDREPNSGTLDIAGADAEITVTTWLHFGPDSIFTAVPGATIHMTGSAFQNENIDPADLAGFRNLILIFEGGSENVDLFEVAGEDIGSVWPADGFDNFELNTLTLGGLDVGQIQLVDLFDNQPNWQGNEALYVYNLNIAAGSYLDLNGLTLYYFTALIDPAAAIVYNGGKLMQIPEPTTMLIILTAIPAIFRSRRR